MPDSVPRVGVSSCDEQALLDHDEALRELEHKALSDVLAERAQQDQLWGQQNHTGLVYLGILLEEVGEYAKELLDIRFTDKGDASRARTEAVQVAAVALAIVECLDRNGVQA